MDPALADPPVNQCYPPPTPPSRLLGEHHGMISPEIPCACMPVFGSVSTRGQDPADGPQAEDIAEWLHPPHPLWKSPEWGGEHTASASSKLDPIHCPNHLPKSCHESMHAQQPFITQCCNVPRPRESVTPQLMVDLC